MTNSDEQLHESWRRTLRTAPADSPCPSSKRLAALASGQIWPWQRRSLVDHLAGCPACAADYRVLDAARDGLQSALRSHLPGRRAGPAFGRFGFAAVALVAVVAGGLLFSTHSDLVRSPGQASDAGAAPDAIFSSAFEPAERPAANARNDSDTLFHSNFSAPQNQRDGTFSDGFG